MERQNRILKRMIFISPPFW